MRTALYLAILIVTSRPAWPQTTTSDPPSQQQEERDRSAVAGSRPTEDSQTPDRRDRIYYPGDTERLKPLGRKLIGNILLDQKEIWTSPFHMNRGDAKWWLGFGALTGGLIAADRHIANGFENSKGQVRWGNRVSNIGASYTVIPLVAGFYGYGVFKDDPKARETGVLGTEALLDSLITVEILKLAFQRQRPESTDHPGKFFSGGSSFPSGHAIESWALASLVSQEYGQDNKWVPFVAYGLSSVVSVSRIAAQKHYASDVVAGAAMGWFIGRYVYNTHVNHGIHNHAWARPQIVPQFEPASRTYGMALVFNAGQ